MPQDTFTLRLYAKELDSALKGGRLNKINQPSKEEISLLIYTGKHTVKLTVNANASDCGVYVTEDVQENPLVAPNFCMLLRKYLTGAEILRVSTPGFERILIFDLLCRNDFSTAERKLCVEVMGKYSNVILVENDIILGAMKTTALDDACKRMILNGAKYTLPAPQDKVNPADLAALKALLKTPPEGDLARFLFMNVMGLAPCTAEEIVACYAGGDLAEHVYGYIFCDEISPSVVERNAIPADFFARRKEGIPFPTLLEAQTYFYRKRREKKFFEGEQRKLLSAVSSAKKKEEKRLAQILEKRQSAECAEENRIKGELLTANLYRLTRGMQGCEVENYYDGSRLKITLDERLTPAQNAQAYYIRYRKQKRTLEFLAPQEAETRAELDYLESVLTAVQSADSEYDLKSLCEELTAAGLLKAPQERTRKVKQEIPYRTYEREGIRLYAGRNNLQNDRLLRSSAPEDIWLHAQKYHSCHVVIKTEGKAVPDSVLEFAARVCARYSSGKGGKIPVDYCKVKYVKKPPKSKAGFVRYTDYKTLLVEPLEEENRKD